MEMRMKKRWIAALALAAMTAWSAIGADANFSPWDAWRKGINHYEVGEQARNRADYVTALKSFRDAVDQFRSVRRARPDWNQNFINAKIAGCEEEIASINRLLRSSGGAAADPAPAADGGTSGPEPASGVSASELAALKTEIEQYKKKLFEALAELDELRRQSSRTRATGDEMENLMRERRILVEKNQLLETRYRELEKKANEPNSDLDAAKKQAIELKINSEMLERKLQLAGENLNKLEKEITTLYRQRNDLQKELDTVKKAGERVGEELATLRQVRDNAGRDKANWELREKELQSLIDRAIKTAEGKQQEIELLNRRLKEAAAQSGTLNADLVAENEKLRTAAAAATKAAEEATRGQQEVQNKLRELQLELTDVRGALLRVDDRRLQAENELKLVHARLEKQIAAEELAGVELKNLRDQNQKLNDDLKSWADKVEKAEKELNTRRGSEYAAISGANADNRKLRDEIARAKIEKQEVVGKLESAAAKQKQAEQETNDIKVELLKQRATLLGLEQQVRELTPAAAERDNLKLELTRLKQNFTALQSEVKEGKAAQAELEKSRGELVKLRETAQTAEKLRTTLAEQERRNQELLDDNARLRNRKTASTADPGAPGGAPVQLPPPEAMPPEKIAELLRNAEHAEKNGDKEVAVWNYKSILEARKDHFEANRNLGKLLVKDEKYDEAVSYFQQAQTAKPDDTDNLIAYAGAQIGLKKYGNALLLLEKAKATPDQNYDFALALGRAQAGAGKPDDAEKSLLAAGKLRPDAARPHLELARLLAGKRQEDAAKYYEKAKKLGAPPDAELEPVLGKVLNDRRELIQFLSAAAAEAEKHHDAVSAVWYFAQLGELDGNSADYAARHGLYLLIQNKPAEALKALENRPESPAGKLVAAVAAMQTGNFAAAAEAAGAALKLNAGKPVKLPPEFAVLRAEAEKCADAAVRKTLLDAIAGP
jgi:Tfp pilus assembly protein PilF